MSSANILEIRRQFIASLAEIGDRLDIAAKAIERQVLQRRDARCALAQAHCLILLDADVHSEDGGENHRRGG